MEDPQGAAEPVDPEVYEAILRSLPDTTVFVFGLDLRYRLVEGTGLRQTGWAREEIVGRRPSEIMLDEPEGARRIEEAMRAALAGETRHHEIGGQRRSGFHWENTISPLTSPTGEVVGGLVISRNLGPLKRAEADRARSQKNAVHWSRAAHAERRLRERLEFLAGIDRVLAACRDRREIMRAVVSAGVPRLGDWCSIHVLMDPHDPVPAYEVGHVDPAMVQLAAKFVEAFPYDRQAAYGIPYVVRTGEPVLLSDIDPDVIEASVSDELGLQVIRRLGLTSSLIVPLGMRGETFGALTFSVSGGDRVLDEDDVALAAALAGRVAASLDNRRLAEVQRHIAVTLQRSLLPAELPDIPGVEVAVGYWAAGEGTDVGGDFYDVFDTGHGCHAVVIGDVCGSGPGAAAVTATVRHTVRALARRGDDHATVLRQLNDAVLTSWPDIFCTVAYATIESSASCVHVTATSGGHPLPILVRADGSADFAGRPGMLIGISDIPDPVPFEMVLSPGDTLVFYTDGAFDLPPPHDLSQEDLVGLVAAAARETDADAVLKAIARGLESRTPFEEREDDIAVVVLRVPVTPQP